MGLPHRVGIPAKANDLAQDSRALSARQPHVLATICVFCSRLAVNASVIVWARSSWAHPLEYEPTKRATTRSCGSACDGNPPVFDWCLAVAAYEACIPAEGLTNTARGSLKFVLRWAAATKVADATEHSGTRPKRRAEENKVEKNGIEKKQSKRNNDRQIVRGPTMYQTGVR